jgi:hypothetical protein
MRGPLDAMCRLHQRLGILAGQRQPHVLAILLVGFQVFAGHAASHRLIPEQG